MKKRVAVLPGERLHPDFLALPIEDRFAVRHIVLEVPADVHRLDDAPLRIALESGFHAELRVQPEPLPAGEVAAQGVVEVAQAEGAAFAARMQPETRPPVEEDGAVLAGRQLAFAERLARHHRFDAIRDAGPRLSLGGPGDRHRRCRKTIGKAEVGVPAAADDVFPDRQEVESGDGEPAPVRGQFRLRLLAVPPLPVAPGVLVERPAALRTATRRPDSEREERERRGPPPTSHRRAEGGRRADRGEGAWHDPDSSVAAARRCSGSLYSAAPRKRRFSAARSGPSGPVRP